MPEYIVQIDKSESPYDEHFVGALRRYPELIRCKDCKFLSHLYENGKHLCRHDEGMILCTLNDYCSKAEKQEDSL